MKPALQFILFLLQILCFIGVHSAQQKMSTFSARAGWQWYKGMLSKRPLTTKATTSMVLMSISDVLCQKMETEMAKDIVNRQGPDTNLQGGCPTNTCSTKPNAPELFHQDWKRTREVAVTGLTWSGPISHAWYAILEAIVRVENPFLGLICRLVLDAAVFSPVAVAGYFTWRTFLEGGDVQDLITKLKLKWMGAVQASWSFWPAANVINFGFVPVQFR